MNLSRADFTEDQQKAIDRLYNFDETFLVAPTGAGKTAILLTAISELIEAGVLSRVLIIAPLKVCLTTWTSEHEKWSHLKNLKITIATGAPGKRAEALQSSANVVVINEENVNWLFFDNRFFCTDIGFDGIAIDETSRWSHTGGARFKTIRHKMKHFSWRVGMTAEPVSENWVKLFGQILLIDLGKALGRSRDRYQRRYFFPTDWEQHNWEVVPGRAEDIAERIAPLVHVMPDYKAETLPPKTVKYVPIQLEKEAFRRYSRMRIDSVLTVGSMGWPVKIKAGSRAVLSGKLEQIAAGFSYVAKNEAPKDFFYSSKAEAKKRAPRAVFHHSQKVDWACARAQEIADSGESVIVVYWFQWELEMLRARIPGVLELNGSPASIRQTMKKWRKCPPDILLLQPSSASHGVDGLQYTCHRQLWLGPIWSRDRTNQAGDRLWRRGQNFEVEIEVAVAMGTVDEVKVASVENKSDHHELFLAHLGGGELSQAERAEIENATDKRNQ